MKRKNFLLLLLCAVLLAACTKETLPEAGKSRPAGKKTVTLAPTETPTPEATSTPTPTPTNTPTPTPEPIRMLDAGAVGLKKDDIVDYYCRVGLTSEYTNGNVIDFVRKWPTPILYTINGTPNADDLALVDRLIEALNGIEGFPGMYPADPQSDSVNFTMMFLDTDEYKAASLAAIGDEFTDGFSSIWFMGGDITQAEIGVCNDLTRTNKNHVILEEIIQALGLQNDTYDYPDSLFYQGYNEPQWPTELDWFLLRFLYHPELEPGMKEPNVRMTAELIIKE
ncbi:MAG: DUF2927 domain-containing protein [Lachnospiraceae bacterium]|nr:DUF2927 domain-containing protein [Lachnospiraceae bacterium]